MNKLYLFRRFIYGDGLMEGHYQIEFITIAPNTEVAVWSFQLYHKNILNKPVKSEDIYRTYDIVDIEPADKTETMYPIPSYMIE